MTTTWTVVAYSGGYGCIAGLLTTTLTIWPEHFSAAVCSAQFSLLSVHFHFCYISSTLLLTSFRVSWWCESCNQGERGSSRSRAHPLWRLGEKGPLCRLLIRYSWNETYKWLFLQKVHRCHIYDCIYDIDRISHFGHINTATAFFFFFL